MTADQIMIFVLLILMLILFIWGKWRYDVIAVGILLLAAFVGLVPMESAFAGFANPAVMTVAAVLILTKGLTAAGVVDYIAKYLLKVGDNTLLQITLLVLAVTVSSAFINNIGALALMMPVAIKMARRSKKSPSLFLMPLAFGSLLGGMTTLMGTPPNILISNYRAETFGGVAFRIFDFLPVGGGVALAGFLFIVLIGWRFLPERKGARSPEDLFEIKDYITKLHVPAESKFIGRQIYELEKVVEGDLKVVSIISNDVNYAVPSLYYLLKAEDLVVVEATAQEIQELVDATDLELADLNKITNEDISSEDVELVEAVVMSNSFLLGRTAKSLRIRTRFGINLLGVARAGIRIKNAPDSVRFTVGDILLLQGNSETLSEILNRWGCLPLAGRGLTLGKPRRLISGLVVFAGAVLLAAIGVLPVQIAFVAASLFMVVGGFVSIKELYESIDWSIIVLLGAIIPVSKALETTGGANLIAEKILLLVAHVPLWVSVMIVLIVSMTLSDIVNNAAAVLIMAPIAVEVAWGLSVSPDALLMSVAIGASCSFLTPIGHQSNILVMGPGGYKFGDYWKMGLPLELVVVAVATPLIVFFWM